ncbi:MAG: MBL fold metallo-hydrolase [Patescibacteria group bacterium]|nr:MBL fold metallo-hydrolase [Patescibacteria group bacterium]
MSRCWKIAWVGVAVLLIGNILVWSAVAREERGGVLQVAFLDVGQGDAIYIEAPNGNQVLIDGGPGKAVLRQLPQVMPFYDKSIDLLIATHPDADHISGLVSVLERYQVDYFMEPGVESETGVYRALQEAVQEEGLESVLARRGLRVNLDPERNVYLDILFPDRDPKGWKSNDASIITKLSYGRHSFLLTGDAPKKMEQYVSELNAAGLAATVLKVGHHGSQTSSDQEFVSAVSPDYAVISVNANNRYGHPHQVVLDTLDQLKIKILDTTEGNIQFETDGINLELI